MAPVQTLSDDEMERKFVELDMPSILNRCEAHPFPRPHQNPIKKKREYTVDYRIGNDLRLRICYFDDADGSERRSIRYMKDDNGNEYER